MAARGNFCLLDRCEVSAGFTEGPWVVSDEPVLAIVAREGHPTIAEITAVDDRTDCAAEVEANANLIAAAPDMHGALEDVPLPSVSNISSMFVERFYDWYNGARADALNKARGIASEVSSVGGLK